jgi:hypothetical protein
MSPQRHQKSHPHTIACHLLAQDKRAHAAFPLPTQCERAAHRAGPCPPPIMKTPLLNKRLGVLAP